MARPLVYACAGNSDEARLAERVAVGLERVGAAELSSVVAVAANVPSLVRAARSGRPVIAVDGCRRGCSATLLRSRGIRVSRAVRLDELGELDPDRLVEAVAAGLGRGECALRYLDPLLELHPEGVAAATVARRVGVTRPSAREALEGLGRQGLVARLADRRFALTRAGAALAREAARRRRVVERFLGEFLGYGPEAARELAPPLAAALSDDAVERLSARLSGAAPTVASPRTK